MNRVDQFGELRKHWTPPRELGHSAPRPVRLSGGGLALAGLAAALVAGAVVVAALAGRSSARQTKEYRLLAREGLDTDARIVRLWRTSGEGRHYRMEYWYRAGGRTYMKELKVPARVWKTLPEGGTITVRFLPSNPDFHRPLAWAGKPLSIWIAILIPAGMIALALLIVVAIRRQSSLLAEGRPAPAVIWKIDKVHHAHGGAGTVVHYEFPVMSGRIVKGKSDRAAPKGSAPGTVLCAIYDPENPRRSALYPLCTVRVART